MPRTPVGITRHTTSPGHHRRIRATKRAALAAALTAASCLGVAAGSATGAAGAAAAPSGTLEVGVAGLPPTQGNPFGALGTPSIYTWSAMFDALTLVDVDGQATPALATSWEVIADDTWEFTLRDDVTFSNGEPFDADAVVTVWDYLGSEEGSATVVGRELRTIAAIEATDELTIQITTNGPDPVLPNRLAAVFMVAPDHWTELGPDGFAADPVGTGPYRVESWENTAVTLSAVPDSWRTPQVETIVMNALPETASRIQALQSDQIHIALSVSPDQIEAIEASGASIDVRPAPQVMSLAFNSLDPDSPFADQRVRLALNLAVDREAIVEGLVAGLAAPASQGTTPGANGHNSALEPMPYDPERAVELLTEAGYPDGFSFVAEVVTGSFPADGDIYLAMAENLRQIGVEVELRQLTFPEWLEKYNAGTWDGEAFGLSWNTAPLLDAARVWGIFSCLKPTPFFCAEDQLELINAASETLDADARREILAELAVLSVENPPALLLIEQIDLHAVGAGVTGFENINRFIPYENISIA